MQREKSKTEPTTQPGFWGWMKMVALSPVYVAQIFSTKKNFKDNPILGSERLNRRGLHVWRVKTTARIVEWRRRQLKHLVPERERQFFRENGYIMRQNFLPEAEFRALVAEIEALKAPAREMTEGLAITRRMALPPEVVAGSPQIAAFLKDRRWSDPIRYVGGFDVEPVLTVQTIFGSPSTTADEKDPQTNLHMDTFHSTVKAWYFLYDVPEDEGPFTYVAGSHKLTKRRLAWQKRMSILASKAQGGGAFRIPAAMMKRLHLPEPTKFAVPANTLVIGDTFGFHARGYSARESIRVELYASLRPNPFMPFLGIDAGRLPFVSGRKQVITWHIEDWLQRLGLARPTMTPVGEVHPRERHTAARD